MPATPANPGPDLEKFIRELRIEANSTGTSGTTDTNHAALLKGEVDFVDKQRSEIKQLAVAYEKAAEDVRTRFDKLVTYAIHQEKEIGDRLDDLLDQPDQPDQCGQQQSGQYGQQRLQDQQDQASQEGQYGRPAKPGQQSQQGHSLQKGQQAQATASPDSTRFDIQAKVRSLREELIKAEQDVTDLSTGAEKGALDKLRIYDGAKHAADLTQKRFDALKAALKWWEDRLKAWQGLKDAADKNRQTEDLDYAYAYVLFLLTRLTTQANPLDPSEEWPNPNPAFPGWDAATAWLADDNPSQKQSQPVALYAPISSGALMKAIEDQFLLLLKDRRTILTARFEAEEAQTGLVDARKTLAEIHKSGLERILQSLKPLHKPGT